ncbi:MAG: hypothetical protein L7H18_00545 [Candidatus Nealsonbacteria bacterium DGGOD1a]|nr:MAG: hypothetical protein L7H18_00545 [Candidatus Nealsonbacteria bacterium DGGOD1a]
MIKSSRLWLITANPAKSAETKAFISLILPLAEIAAIQSPQKEKPKRAARYIFIIVALTKAKR